MNPTISPDRKGEPREPARMAATEKPMPPTPFFTPAQPSAESATHAKPRPELPFGDQILQSLLGQAAPPVAPRPAEAFQPPVTGTDRVHAINQLAEQLAQRILVPNRRQTVDSEVRIQLRETVLQGAEIALRRDQGQLLVTFNFASSDAARLLSPQATDDLQRVLAGKLGESVRIEVNVSSQGAGSQGHPGDGRSRNRQDPRDPWHREP